MTAVGISGIGQIHISVADVDRAVAFYRDVLELPFLFQVQGQPMAFFDCGGVRLYLGEPESPAFRSNPVLYLTVASIQDAYEELRRRGVAFRGEPHVVHRTETSELWMALFNDPDGTRRDEGRCLWNLLLMADVPVATA